MSCCLDLCNLGKSLRIRREWGSLRSPPYSIRSVLERTSLMAVLLGYGLLLLFNVQLPAEQRRQSQLEALEYAKDLLGKSKDSILRSDPASASGASIDPVLLKRLLSDFSSFRLVLWMHPKGFEAGLVKPDVISNVSLGRVLGLRYLQNNQGNSQYGPILIDVDSGHYSIAKDEIKLHGNTWNIYLLEDVSRQIYQQKILILIIILAGSIASMVTLFLARTGIRRGLEPLQRFGCVIESVSSGSLDDHRCELEHEPLELKPLASSFNSLLDRLAESWNRQRKFANALSHELRTPITLITGYSSRVLSQSGNLNQDQRHQLTIIDDETRRLGRLITDLLDIAREKTGALVVTSEPFSVLETLEQVFLLNRGDHETRLKMESSSHGMDQTWAFGDHDRVVQCLGNLIENAFKYSSEDKCVELSCSSTHEHVRLQVRDHGPGVLEADQELIFEQFQRGSNTAEQPGSGVGLALVRSLMKRMRGHVWVENAADGGAIFVIELQRCQPPQQQCRDCSVSFLSSEL
ncbi:HAMP domain-containing histidine kinase [Cyanobacteria bacterium 150NLHA]|nr:Sensor kinase CusS [Prochlorococcus marinus str. MIT 1312]KZR81553.1 Sensor kinase CusS [Prochlorococcus marinus str. MIT 1327]NMO83069.1 HAMP domain-containing histidine kinase [Prochlorococcus sp. P1344]NMP05732.1 HAMP domain-containing histidine kinase [Prochlorococcus sp. P1361]NMP13420.1 HAMP domain-containing histidine kinase [Prochlorococcus sp.P1363]